MRKPSFPPKRYRHKRSGREFVRLRLSGTKPRDVYLDGPAGSTQADAHYARLVAELAAGRTPLPPANLSTMTVADVVAQWFTDRGNQLQPNQRWRYRYASQPLVDLYGPTLAREFRPKALVTVQREMVRRGWCRNVVNRRVVAIRTIWRWAEQEELVPAGAFANLCTVRGLSKGDRTVRHTPPVQPASPEDLAKLLPHCSSVIAAMLRVQALTGMRSQEVRLMRADRIERFTGCAVWWYTPERDKTGHLDGSCPRRVPLGPQCQEILGPWLERFPTGYLFRALDNRRRKGIEHYSEHSYTQCGYSRAVKRSADLAGVKLFPYQLRHAAKQRIEREHGPAAAKAILGHSSMQTTAQYARQQDTILAAQVAKKLA